jgi:ATP-binding cassette subfamily B (MDR/TAP) protein 1
MRRPTGLTVATDVNHHDDKDVYELSQSPRSLAPSLAPPAYDLEKGDVFTSSIPTPASTTTTTPTLPPSIALLFSSLSRRELLLFLLPAVLTSLLAGGIAPFMTRVIGAQFDTFAAYPLKDANAGDKHALLRGVGIAALQLLGLACGSLVLSSITSSLWICTGEKNVASIRKTVFGRVANMNMAWFDTQSPAEGAAASEDGPIGAGGLMAKFAR